MSVKSLGRLTLDMVLKTGNFLGPMDKAGRHLKPLGFEQRGVSFGGKVTSASC